MITYHPVPCQAKLWGDIWTVTSFERCPKFSILVLLMWYSLMILNHLEFVNKKFQKFKISYRLKLKYYVIIAPRACQQLFKKILKVVLSPAVLLTNIIIQENSKKSQQKFLKKIKKLFAPKLLTTKLSCGIIARTHTHTRTHTHWFSPLKGRKKSKNQ